MADANETKHAAKPAPPAGSGGFTAWLPLMLSLVLMPALAYFTTTLVLVPKIKKSLGPETVSAREPGGEEPEGSGSSHETPKGKGPRTKVPVTKIIVNVSGSLGSRMLLASFTLAGSTGDFKTRVEDNLDQLRDLASSILASKTIGDLEKPESRNLIRAELLSQLNAVLGGSVQEIYFTEFAIQ